MANCEIVELIELVERFKMIEMSDLTILAHLAYPAILELSLAQLSPSLFFKLVDVILSQSPVTGPQYVLLPSFQLQVT